MKVSRPLAVIALLASSILPFSASAAPKDKFTLAAAAPPRTPDTRASRSAVAGDDDIGRQPWTVAPSTTTTIAPTTTTSTSVPKTATTVSQRPTTTARPVTISAPRGNDVVSIALAQVGKSYVSGAEGPNAFDCSGLVYYVFNQAGVKIPRLSSDGYFAKYAHVSKASLQPGDVVVYPGHIAIYVGNGEIVSASTPRGGVKHYGMTMPGSPIGYARIV